MERYAWQAGFWGGARRLNGMPDTLDIQSFYQESTAGPRHILEIVAKHVVGVHVRALWLDSHGGDLPGQRTLHDVTAPAAGISLPACCLIGSQHSGPHKKSPQQPYLCMQYMSSIPFSLRRNRCAQQMPATWLMSRGVRLTRP